MIPSCRELAAQATEYQEGALPFARRLAVRLHLLVCRGCRNLLAQLAHTVELVRRLPRPPVAAATREALVAAYRAARPPA